MIDLPSWVDVLRHRLPDEKAGEHVVRIIRNIEGFSLENNSDLLADLFLINEPTVARADLVSHMKTNCGTIMRQVWALAGCDQELILCSYDVGMAVAWNLEAARRKGALLPGSRWRSIKPGWGLHYSTPGKNDDHMEFCLERPLWDGNAEHAGGGRSKNAITIASSDIRWSSGRPLQHIINPESMADSPATGDNPY